MTEIKKQIRRDGEQGNVLFLILIAVALFAALSYAVTQSSRSGSGDAGKETNLVNSSQLTQYPAAVRTALVRMIIGGRDLTSPITFNSPSDFTAIINTTAKQEINVFHPLGGGSSYAPAPGELMSPSGGNLNGLWYFNANFEVPNIGIDGAGGNEVIAFLPGITQALCKQLNDKYGISGTPAWNPTDASVIDNILDGDAFPDGTASETFDAALTGQPFGCYQDSSTSAYTYFHVLIER